MFSNYIFNVKFMLFNKIKKLMKNLKVTEDSHFGFEKIDDNNKAKSIFFF